MQHIYGKDSYSKYNMILQGKKISRKFIKQTSHL